MRPRHAIILAAGMGTRLRPIGHHGPKGALVLHQRSIVEDSVQRLLHAGIERITLVTGYQADFYRSLADSMPAAINCVHNPEYADSGSMYSLYLAREQVDGDFLLLESDLIYEQRALSVVLEDPAENLLLLSGKTGAGDEVYVAADQEQRLLAMSKRRDELHGEIAGELVGISKISTGLFAAMCSHAGAHFRDRASLHLDYETDAMVAAGRNVPIYCVTIDDLLWSEIDDAAHYRRAVEIDRLIRNRDAAA
ncbi:MAG: phosphocholine cytidylyltransferase family protein [Chromatiaceae bacterium]|nr:phosphocholine cytidylyltransferase family protein [Gammaproteobacteria bacterium]MCB1879134.1 phosphocholine cytidylyltransferase family protein [Gammaproteobacteria bacterium]MCP5428244.1 phosphocholine cytidylyltransferase family protein [Chromatiaceae bacterium]MCP5448764.1 phosphocholine cytidylyltransferase family protein [Chromatiaceae bacterium]